MEWVKKLIRIRQDWNQDAKFILRRKGVPRQQKMSGYLYDSYRVQNTVFAAPPRGETWKFEVLCKTDENK